MSTNIICDFIRKYGKIVFLNYDNDDYSEIIYEDDNFKLFKYVNNMLVENKLINEDEINKLKLEYEIAYFNNNEFRINKGNINLFKE